MRKTWILNAEFWFRHKKETLNRIITKKDAKIVKHCFFSGGGQLYADFRFSWEVLKPNPREGSLYFQIFVLRAHHDHLLLTKILHDENEKNPSMSFTTSSDRQKSYPGRLFATGRTPFFSNFLHLIHVRPIWYHSSYCVKLETWILRIVKTKYRN